MAARCAVREYLNGESLLLLVFFICFLVFVFFLFGFVFCVFVFFVFVVTGLAPGTTGGCVWEMRTTCISIQDAAPVRR